MTDPDESPHVVEPVQGPAEGGTPAAPAATVRLDAGHRRILVKLQLVQLFDGTDFNMATLTEEHGKTKAPFSSAGADRFDRLVAVTYNLHNSCLQTFKKLSECWRYVPAKDPNSKVGWHQF